MFQRDRNKMVSSGQAARFASHLTKTGDLGLDFHLAFALLTSCVLAAQHVTKE